MNSKPLPLILNAIYLFMYVFMYLFIERGRERVQAGEGQRKKETQNSKQAPGSEVSAQSLMWGSNSWTMRA